MQNFVANRRFCGQRGFSILPVIGLTSTLMITWEVITSYADTLPQVKSARKLTAGTSYRTLFNALENGGPAGLIYGYLFVWCGVILQALVMAEMASMYVFAKAMPTIRSLFVIFASRRTQDLDALPALSARLRYS